MWARMHSRSKRNAIWLCNTDVNPDLDQLFFTGATNDLPVRFVTYGDDGVMRIKGKPVVETEYNSSLGTEGDFMLVDLTQYLFIQKLLQTASSMHVAFATDEQAFRVTWRVDGKPAWVSALTPFKGSATLSPFITVAA
jgi:HK97 family phage major capsid protein